MDPYTIGALGLLALAALYALRPGHAPALAPRRPGRTLIDVVEETGKDAAGKEIETRLGRQKAGEIARSIAAAFADVPAPGPAPAADAPKG